MAGVHAATGKVLSGWPHVLQSIGIILTTGLGARVMRRYFGSVAGQLLGASMNQVTILRFFQAVTIAIELWEPRYRISKITVLTLTRGGFGGFQIDGVYRPRGHLGDFTPEGTRRITLSVAADGKLGGVT